MCWTMFSATETRLRFYITYLNEQALILAWSPTWNNVSVNKKVLLDMNDRNQFCLCNIISQAGYAACFKWH